MQQQSKSDLTKVFENFLEEYLLSIFRSDVEIDEKNTSFVFKEINRDQEKLLVSKFLSTPCTCGKNCQKKFSENELLESRKEFRYLSRNEKNCVILAQLDSFQRRSEYAKSAEQSKQERDRNLNIESMLID